MNGVHGVGTLFIATGKDGWVREARMVRSTGSKTLDDFSVQFALANWRGPANQKRSIVMNYRLTKSEVPARIIKMLTASPVLAAYNRAIIKTIEPEWYKMAKHHQERLSIGDRVRISFEVTTEGKPTNVRVVSGREYRVLAELSMTALLDTRLPRFTPEVTDGLHRLNPPRDTMECSYTFDVRP